MTSRRYRDEVEEHAHRQRQEGARRLAEEPDLFSQPVPSYPVDTSMEAAEALQPTVGHLRWKVLKAVCESPDGLTTEQIERATGLKHQTCSPRVWEMARKMKVPFLRYSEDRRGRAHVVRPTEDGLRFYRAEIEAAA